jgi:hypothetical protein
MRIYQRIQRKIFVGLFLISFFISLDAYSETIKAGIVETVPVSIVAEWPISYKTQVGEHFSARVIEDILGADGEVIIPRNSRVVGRVIDVAGPKSFRRNSKIDIQFEKIVLPDNVQSIVINADGSMLRERGAIALDLAEGLSQTIGGAAKGAMLGLKFAGIAGMASSYGNTVMIGAAAGAGLSLVSFVARRGDYIELQPGTPMTMNLISIEKQKYKEQLIAEFESPIEAEVVKYRNNKLKVQIQNKSSQEISLANLKIIDGLGVSVHPLREYAYFDKKLIPAGSTDIYEIEFPNCNSKNKLWLVLTDSFNKKEFFRVAIN